MAEANTSVIGNPEAGAIRPPVDHRIAHANDVLTVDRKRTVLEDKYPDYPTHLSETHDRLFNEKRDLHGLKLFP